MGQVAFEPCGSAEEYASCRFLWRSSMRKAARLANVLVFEKCKDDLQREFYLRPWLTCVLTNVSMVFYTRRILQRRAIFFQRQVNKRSTGMHPGRPTIIPYFDSGALNSRAFCYPAFPACFFRHAYASYPLSYAFYRLFSLCDHHAYAASWPAFGHTWPLVPSLAGLYGH